MDTQQNKNEQDKHLQSPGEANQDKHMDFLEKREMGLDITDADNAGDAHFTPIYLDADNTLQTPGEKKHDETVDPGKSTTVEASEDDLHATVFDEANKGDRRTSVKA